MTKLLIYSRKPIKINKFKIGWKIYYFPLLNVINKINDEYDYKNLNKH